MADMGEAIRQTVSNLLKGIESHVYEIEILSRCYQQVLVIHTRFSQQLPNFDPDYSKRMVDYIYIHLIIASVDKPVLNHKYNPENLQTLERYVEMQASENAYDIDANLAVLKLYEFNPQTYKKEITCQILLKALTNFPHTDFVLCKCLLTKKQCQENPIDQIIYLADILERCDFELFWSRVHSMPDLCNKIVGFQNSIRMFVCHVVGTTFQTIEKTTLGQLLGGVDGDTLKHWVNKYNWKDQGNTIFIANQDENIKTKNITEKIDFENVAGIMATCK